MIVQRLDAPPRDVVDLQELLDHARLDRDDEWAISQMARAAAREAEDLAQIALLNQTIRVTLKCCPRASTVPLPIAPLLDWSTVKITAGGAAFDDFSVTTGLRPAIRLTAARPSGGMVIEYVAGWGEGPSSIPEDLRHAVLDQAVAFYDARGAGDPKTVARSPQFARIVGRYRRVLM